MPSCFWAVPAFVFGPLCRRHGALSGNSTGLWWSALADAIFFLDALLGDYQPAMIIGFIANDIKGVPEDETPKRVKRLFKYFLKQVRERQPNVPFLWIEITPTQSRWAQWEDIQKVNKKIKAYCAKTPQLYFVETAPAFLTQ